MRIAIIGGTSSVGTALKEYFSGSVEVITVGRKNCDITLDLADCSGPISLPANLDAVIHTAAHFGGREDDDITQAENINATGTLRLCQAANKVKAKHFIFISSLFSSLNEDSPQYSIYSLSKKHAEELARYYCSMHSLPLTILKPSQLYGNGEAFRRHQPFFYTLIDKAEKGEDISLFGSHDPLRNYMFIDDLTNIIGNVIQKKVTGMYACAHEKNVTYSEVARAAFKAFNKKGNIFFLADKKDIPDNIFEPDDTLYRRIDYYPRFSIEEGIQKLVNQRHTNS